MGIGARLRQLREERNLSSAAIQSRTRISPRVLQAIERDEFESVPGGIFLRGYLRSYARELDLDPDEVVAQYLAEHAPPPADPTADEPAAPPHAEDVLRRADAGEYALIALVVAAAFVLFYGWPGPLSQGASSVAAPPVPARPGPAVAPPLGPATLPPDVPGLPADALTRPATDVVGAAHRGGTRPAAGAISVTLTATNRVWVTADADGQRVLYRLLQPGERIELTARSGISLRVGDAGALLVALNGDAPVAAGRSGQVRTLRITHGERSALLTQ